MQFSQLRPPLARAAVSSYWPTGAGLDGFSTPLASLRLRLRLLGDANARLEGRRFAGHQSQGMYRKLQKRTHPKKWGAKKTGDQFVIPGNIIFKQKGTTWHPGENCYKGRDHTIHSSAMGYVKYYRDASRHPDRQYIGVVFDKGDTLPYPAGSPRVRQLNMTIITRRLPPPEPDLISPSGIPRVVVQRKHDPAGTEAAETTSSAPATKESSKQAGKAGKTGKDGKDAKGGKGGKGGSLAKAEPAAPQPPAGRDLSKGFRARAMRMRGSDGVLAHMVEQKMRTRMEIRARRRARDEERAREDAVRQGTRVLRLRQDYSYRETNWEIGRLVGDAGTIQGTDTGPDAPPQFRRLSRSFWKRVSRRAKVKKSRQRKDVIKVKRARAADLARLTREKEVRREWAAKVLKAKRQARRRAAHEAARKKPRNEGVAAVAAGQEEGSPGEGEPVKAAGENIPREKGDGNVANKAGAEAKGPASEEAKAKEKKDVGAETDTTEKGKVKGKP